MHHGGERISDFVADHVDEAFLLLLTLVGFFCGDALIVLCALLRGDVDDGANKSAILTKTDMSQILVSKWGQE